MEHVVSKQEMEALQALSATTLRVSEARATLIKLEETETEYLVSREKKAMDRIQAAFAVSQGLVEETNKNYELIADFASSVREGATFLAMAYEKFTAFCTEKATFFEAWERDIKNQEETVNGLRKLLKVEKVVIESEKNSIETTKKALSEQSRKLDDDRGTLERAFKRLKDNKI